MLSLSLTSHAVGALRIVVEPVDNAPVPVNNERNVTYNCSISEGSVVWQLNEYQLIDRDLFESNGIRVQESERLSEIILRPAGISFLTQQFDEMSFNVQCLAVVNNVNVQAGDIRTVVVYGKLLSLHSLMLPCIMCMY